MAVLKEAMQGAPLHFHTTAQSQRSKEQDIILAELYSSNPGADVIFMERIARILVLHSEFCSTDRDGRLARIEPGCQGPGLPSMTVKEARRLRQVKAQR